VLHLITNQRSIIVIVATECVLYIQVLCTSVKNALFVGFLQVTLMLVDQWVKKNPQGGGWGESGALYRDLLQS